MSLTFSGQLPEAAGPITGSRPVRPVRRVRHEVRDSVAVVAFSAAASLGLATAITLFLALVD